LSAWINMDWGPRSRVAYKKLVYRAQADLLRFQLPEQQFFRDIPGYIIYVGKNHHGDLQEVTIFILQSQTNIPTIHAHSGRLDADMKNKQLTLDLLNAQMVRINPNGGVTISSSKGWSSYTYQLPAEENHSYHPSISDMTFWQLRGELNDLNLKLSLPPVLDKEEIEGAPAQLQALDKQREDLMEPIRVEMNRQIAFSFACFSFTLIGIPLGIRVHRRETNVGVAIALVLVLIYYAFVMLSESLSSRPEFAPHLIFWLPNFIFQAVGAVLLWRANKGL